MIGFGIGLLVGAIACAIVWVYHVHRAALNELAARLDDYADSAWRDAQALEERIKTLISNVKP